MGEAVPLFGGTPMPTKFQTETLPAGPISTSRVLGPRGGRQNHQAEQRGTGGSVRTAHRRCLIAGRGRST
jgi:hypothetical protein